MSYARWSEGDVYVIGGSTGELTCIWCMLQEGGDFETRSTQEMLDHLAAHKEHGHVVPERAFIRLKEEL